MERMSAVSRLVITLALAAVVAIFATGCVVVPTGGYVAAPAIVAPRPVVVAPAPIVVGARVWTRW